MSTTTVPTSRLDTPNIESDPNQVDLGMRKHHVVRALTISFGSPLLCLAHSHPELGVKADQIDHLLAPSTHHVCFAFDPDLRNEVCLMLFMQLKPLLYESREPAESSESDSPKTC